MPFETERRVIATALAWPTRGSRWVSAQLTAQGEPVAPTTVRRVLRRHRLSRRAARRAPVEHHSAAVQGVLTERVRRRVLPHVAAERPGDLLSLDTLYVGQLRGVGKVWQITACDAACSYGWARLVVGDLTANAVLRFLRQLESQLVVEIR